jgi:catechol 2,3-dioxygenase-like lactoylglutathione lyase family enzyme
MERISGRPEKDVTRGGLARRTLLQLLGGAVAGMSFADLARAQGRCQSGYGTQACPLSLEAATAPIKPVFAPTGWRTVALDHITFEMPDYRKEAAFYVALMGWTLRSDDGKSVVLDIGDLGSAVFKHAPERRTAEVTGFTFVIEPWNAKTVEAELRKRGLDPIAENDGNGFESFHVKDPDGWDLQIANGNGLAKARKSPVSLPVIVPFAPTRWKTVWLDHLSFGVTNYKESASFYSNLLGWKETYDEGSQNELLIGDVGDIIIRGGNPFAPNFAKSTGSARRARLDHISFGITPWDTDGVKAELEKRGLNAREDTGNRGEIHVAVYKSYHTTTPNGFNLQMSDTTRAGRLKAVNAVKPKSAGGQ